MVIRAPLPLRSALSWWRRADGAIYALWAATCTLTSACAFYGYMLRQTQGEWSAPLDDVFIHFDYARSIAQGYPFEWTPGNGYSSGNTSLTYPFALAPGWLAGLRDTNLMVWAALIATTSTFALLLAARGLLLRSAPRSDSMRAGSYLLPAVVLSVGALDWSLWSGMEVAFFLGIWAGALRAFFGIDDASARGLPRSAWALGAWGGLLVATRPEAAMSVAAFGLIAALWRARKTTSRERIGVLLRVGLPAFAVLTLQSVANRVLTGETSANGAIVKLAINSPFLTADEKLADYIFNLKYAALRNLEYHFSDAAGYGYIPLLLALFALALPETRRFAVLLWLQIVAWLAMVALNGQVRWQNERYTMPAVAWLLMLATLGAVAMLRRSGRPALVASAIAGALGAQALALSLRPAGVMPQVALAWTAAAGAGAVAAFVVRYWPARAALVMAGLGLAAWHQDAKMRDQIWFFGRASRNIRDQHVTAGRWLGAQRAARILVGDAGALLYASNRPGLDIIGLGGFAGLPFARAGVHGLPATLELIERVMPRDRPDVFAIYPSWWGTLPVWFSRGEVARFPAPGNVICGGYEDVIFLADWHLLGTGEAPRAVAPSHVRDSVDVADLVSEKAHQYVFPHPAGGWTDMKVLPDPADSYADLFDAGRRTGAGRRESMRLSDLAPRAAARLVVRSAPDAKTAVSVSVGSRVIGVLAFEPRDAWDERVIDLPADAVDSAIDVAFDVIGPGDFVNYHVWITQ